jgi:Flp pilus assembly protein TadB
MQQRTIITRTEDIRSIARDISIFSCKKQIFKVQLSHISETENFEVEKKLVRLYSLGQHGFWAVLPVYTILVYLLLLFANIIPYHELGIVPTILLYAPFAIGAIFFLRILATFYAKRSLLKLAQELQTDPSFTFG